MPTVTFFKNILTREPYYCSLDDALLRIKNGKSKTMVESIRNEISKDKRNALKKELPSVLFSGKFKGRADADLIKHSGFVILDFDEIIAESYIAELKMNEYIYAAWVSPSGNGVKALIKIADSKTHRELYESICKEFTMADPVNKNVASVAFESYDPNIYINPESKIWTKVVQKEKITITEKIKSENEIFNRLKKWLINSGSAFQSGERNIYIFKLASACCRFGMDEFECKNLIDSEYLSKDSEFTKTEAEQTIKSAYKANASNFGTAIFENEKVITKETKIEIDPKIFDESIKPRDVIYGMDVIEDALRIYDIGYESAETTYIAALDDRWKFKRGEMTLISGIGNHGKSSWLQFLLLIQSVKKNYKWAMFSPESFPAHEFYHDLTEVILGCDCSAHNPNRPSRERYADTYKRVSESFFFTYPIEKLHTPELIRERFLELVIKEKVDGMVIDPFNQLANDWGDRDDKYLERFLSESAKFARETHTFFFIINHPKQLRKDGSLNYPCPDVYDLANGAMWNNKMDNIMIYHRPNYGTDPYNSTCELHIKKIRRQKIVGTPGIISFEYKRQMRRYYFNDGNPFEAKQLPLMNNFYETEKDDLPFI